MRLTVGAISYLHHLAEICRQHGGCNECPLSAQGRPVSEAQCPRVRPNPFSWKDDEFAEMVRNVEAEYRRLKEK